MSRITDAARLLRIFWGHERRHIEVALFDAVILPVTMAYLGFMIAGDDAVARRFFLAAAITLGLGNGAIFLVGMSLLEDRFSHRLDLLRTLRVSKGAYFAAHLGLGLAQSVLLAVSAWGVLVLADWIEPSGRALVWLLVAALCSGVAMGGLAAAVALRVRDELGGNVAILLCALVLGLSSPVFYAADALPPALRPLTLLSPYSHVAELVRAALSGGPPPLVHAAGGVLLAAAFNVSGFQVLRWRAR